MHAHEIGLIAGFDDDLVEVHVRRPRGDETDDLGDVLRDEWVHPAVRRRGFVGVAVVTYERELGFHRAGRDFGEPDRLSEQFTAQRSVQKWSV